MQPTDPDPLIGAVLEGQFLVERLIGRGGMGRVYIAESRRLKRRCALKVLLPELTADERCVERFLREAQAIAQIHHENVVDIHHLGEDQRGIVFFAMELLSGEDLASRLKRRDQHPFDWRQACRWMLQVARAIIAVHAAGLIHRDLKPSNVFLARTPDGGQQIKLLDFGIVKADDQATLTGTGTVIGTASYMSPEQIQGDPIDRRTDIYSFGVLFYEVLAGRKPFIGEPLQIAYQHCHSPPPSLRQFAPDIPPELGQLVMNMLTKAVGERVQTVEAIEQILLEILSHQPVHGAAAPAPFRSATAWVVPTRSLLAGEAPAKSPVRREASPPAAAPPRIVAEPPPPPTPSPAASSPRTTAAPWTSLLLLGLSLAAIAIIGHSLELWGSSTSTEPEPELAAPTPIRPDLREPAPRPSVEPVAAPVTTGPATVDPIPVSPIAEKPGTKTRSPGKAKRTDAPATTDSAADLAKQGTEALNAGRRSEAEKLFDAAIRADPACAEALIGLSDIYFDRGSPEQARRHAEQAVNISPNNATYRLKLGDAYFKAQRYRDALTQYEAAQQLGDEKAAQRITKARARLAE